MATISTRLSNTGTLYINGALDEVTQSTISTRPDTVLAAEFDEVSNNRSSVARRDSANGAVQISGIFDELTGAPVVDETLKFWIDAAQSASYQGQGPIWYDLSGSGADVTLYNSPIFSSQTTGGSIDFIPGNLQYGETSVDLGNMPTWSAEAWVKVTQSLNGQITSVITNQFNLASSLNYSIGTNKAPGDYNLCVGFFDGAWHNTEGFVPTLDTWYQVVGTYDGSYLIQYVNGVNVGSPVNYTGAPGSGGVTRIARRWDSPTDSGNLFPGEVSVVKIYNRALTADEVAQNFNALRRRYNI